MTHHTNNIEFTPQKFFGLVSPVGYTKVNILQDFTVLSHRHHEPLNTPPLIDSSQCNPLKTLLPFQDVDSTCYIFGRFR